VRFALTSAALPWFASETAVASPSEPTVTRDEKRAGSRYVLAPGETVSEVARRHDVPLERVMRSNGWSDDDLMRLGAGDTVLLPGIRPSETIGPNADALYHRMRPDESLWDVASRYQVGVSELVAANELEKADASRLHPGRRLRVPGVVRLPTGELERVVSRTQRRAKALAERLGMGTPRAAGRLWRGWSRQRWTAAAGPAALANDTLLWPVPAGHYVRGFGSGKGQYHLAIDIAADVGQKVRAAADGVVAYVGDAISDYGNMVFVVHPGAWITMYAHNSANEVVAGQRVARGDIVAEVGSTGISRGPHVHFELLYRGKNCDPTHLFRPGVRMPGGRFAEWSGTVHWQPGEHRPRSVECHPRRQYPDS
jgi:murein DD-endopeptidase MepM/ murein hydrolase activator NlpD